MAVSAAAVAMVIICWMPQRDGTLKEVWRINKAVSAEHCLKMSELAGGGIVAAITVSCRLTKETPSS